MNLIKEFKIEQISLSNYKVTDPGAQSLKLYNNYLKLAAWSEGEHFDNDKEMFVARKFSNRLFCEKTNVTSIELNWSEKEDAWILKLSITGNNTDLVFDFKDAKEASNIYKELIEWKLN